MEWRGAQFKIQVMQASDRRLEMACIHLKNRIRVAMSRSQPTVGHGIHKRGLDPSKPGEYPKIVTGFERRNVQHEFDRMMHAGRVGTNVPYGKFQEIAIDPRRRRPWLSNALRDFGPELTRIIETGQVP